MLDRVSRKPLSRAEHVGSFLRPERLLEARTRAQAGQLSREALRAIEDECVVEIVKYQEALGFRAVTDGEYRRTFFHTDFLLQLQGVVETPGKLKKFHKACGDVDFAPPTLETREAIRHVRPIELRNFEFLKSAASQVARITIPSPTMLHFRGGRQVISQEAYPDLDRFFEDVVLAYQAEIGALGDAGLLSLQLDDTNLAYLCDPAQREVVRARGEDPDALLALYVDLINKAIAKRPAEMTVGIHLCRGNFKSSWAAEGGYEPVAEALFNELKVDTYFLEYDDERSGDFEPLRFMPKGKHVVAGIVSTKQGALETHDEVKRKVDSAARFVPLDQLCLSPQCGFSSTVHGNDLSFAEQTAKLRLVVDVAEEIWAYGN
jgi:5-methyltetrahydropteroyltriglutamate--homocysteine methyltransferase